ncbi:MAG: RluA family pseudouridine synthase [Eubacteriales bacterium]|nr:RluA family pseudouridine synthase [Eubacteriales bacterium]
MEGYQYIVTEKDEIITIKTVLKSRMGISTRLLRKLKDTDGVFLNEKPVKLYEKAKAGDRVLLSMPDENSGFDPEPIPIEVLYEDRDLLAINKQPGFVVHPTKGHVSHTMANGLMQYMIDSGETYKIRFINRLDMNTSGILLIGKKSHCQDDFARQAKENRVVKSYIAVVHGLVKEEEGIIDLPIGKPVDEEIRRQVIPDGYPSVTRYRVLERLPSDHTILSLILETGRTHQIRVHLAHIGHPIVGDSLYGEADETLIERQALHAERLEFDHPITKERLVISASWPEDIIKLIDKLKYEAKSESNQ